MATAEVITNNNKKTLNNVVAWTMLAIGYVLVTPFWSLVYKLFEKPVPPGTMALFWCGIGLVGFNFAVQLGVARKQRLKQALRWKRASALAFFLGWMTSANAIIIVETILLHVRWTMTDTVMVLVAGMGTALFMVVVQAVEHFSVTMSLGIGGAIACRALLQVILAVQDMRHHSATALPLVLFFIAFALCRLVPVVIQWRQDKQKLTMALVLTEGANMVSLLVLLAAWIVKAA